MPGSTDSLPPIEPPPIEPRPKIGDSRPTVAPRPPVVDPIIIEVTVTTLVPGSAAAPGAGEIEATLADGRVAVIDAADFANDDPPAVGAALEVALLARTDSRGRVLVSRRWAVQHVARQRLTAAKAAQETVAGTILRSVKGGMVVDVDGLRAFLPTSLIDEHPNPDQAALVGHEFEFTVVDVDPGSDRVVVSRRDVVRRERRKAERSQWSTVVVGSHVPGTVIGLLEFGVQVELEGGVRGLIHRSELSWRRFHDLGEVVSIGDVVTVEVLDVNKSKHRVGLSLKRLESDPFAGFVVGQLVEGEVVRVVEYGCFVRIDGSSVDGLVHLTELTDQRGMRPDQVVSPGERVVAKILEIDTKRRRLGLSLRQALLVE